MSNGDELVGGQPSRWPQRPLVAVLIALAVVGLVAVRLIQGAAPQASARPKAPATPSPSITAWSSGSVTLLPPLCGTTSAQPPCPRSLPAGVYESELAGLNVEHPFTFRLPDGWAFSMLEFGNGIDLLTKDGVGFSLLLSPRTVSVASDEAAAAYDALGLATALTEDPSVTTTQARRTIVDGATAWQVDARLRPGHPAKDNCRVRPACSVLLLQYVSLLGRAHDVAAGAFPDRTVRLLFLDLPGQQTAVLWVWDTRTLALVAPVIDSIHFCSADQGCPTVSDPMGLHPSATTS